MPESIEAVGGTSFDRRLAGAALGFGVVAWAIPLIVPSETTVDLTREDGIYETLGAFAFLAAGVLFAVVFVRTWHTKRSWWFLALAVLLIFAAGEEVSWGQRLLGWGDVDRATNVQGETTLHNLETFDTVEGGWLKFNRLFLLFWLGWLVVLPALTQLSRSIARLCDRLRLPVAPLVFGLVMIVNLVLSKSYRFLGVEDDALERIAEIRECAQAVALTAVALSFWFAGRAEVSRSADAGQLAAD